MVENDCDSAHFWGRLLFLQIWRGLSRERRRGDSPPGICQSWLTVCRFGVDMKGRTIYLSICLTPFVHMVTAYLFWPKNCELSVLCLLPLPEQIQHKAFLVVLLGCEDTRTPVDRYSRLIMNTRKTVVMIERRITRKGWWLNLWCLVHLCLS